MTKQELLKKLKGSILEHDVFLKKYYKRYYPKLCDLLYIIPDKMQIKYRDGREPVAIKEFPKDFDAFCRDCSYSGRHFQSKDEKNTMDEFFNRLINSLDEWLSAFKDDLLKVTSLRLGVYQRKRRSVWRKIWSAFLVLLGIASVFATFFAILELYGNISFGDGKIGAIIGAVGFSVDVLAFIVERFMDMHSSKNLEKDIAVALNGNQAADMEKFEKKYHCVIKDNTIACCGGKIVTDR